MRKELELGGRHKMAFEDGVIDVVYVGLMEEQHARRLMELSGQYSTGDTGVWVSDLTMLEGFTAAARKVMSQPAPGVAVSPDRETTTYLYIAGATLKTKAVLALVLTATRLLGKIRFEIEYFPRREEALAVGLRKFRELEAAGLARLPEAARG